MFEPIRPSGIALRIFSWSASRLAAACRRLGELACGVHGHEPIVVFGRGSVRLACARCGRRSPGWQVSVCRHDGARARGR
jgi:hypothetical protein